MVLLFPLRVGHDTGSLIQAVDARELPVAEAAGEVGQDVGIYEVQPEGDLVEHGVTGRHQPLSRRQIAAVHLLPVVLGELLSQTLPHWHAVERLAGRDSALLQARRHGHRLEGRAGWIGGQEGTVKEGLPLVVRQLVVLLAAQAVGDPLGVEPRVGGQSQHRVVPRVHGDD